MCGVGPWPLGPVGWSRIPSDASMTEEKRDTVAHEQPEPWIKIVVFTSAAVAVAFGAVAIWLNSFMVEDLDRELAGLEMIDQALVAADAPYADNSTQSFNLTIGVSNRLRYCMLAFMLYDVESGYLATEAVVTQYLNLAADPTTVGVTFEDSVGPPCQTGDGVWSE